MLIIHSGIYCSILYAAMQRRVSMVHDALAESKQFKPELG